MSYQRSWTKDHFYIYMSSAGLEVRIPTEAEAIHSEGSFTLRPTDKAGLDNAEALFVGLYELLWVHAKDRLMDDLASVSARLNH
ncbi:MAG: hypothetical protein HYY21_04450 [Candidatus Tectomicrobia bacterium]|nr:hypothetical protein [Candidatus Tectomicrobia bacterium]